MCYSSHRKPTHQLMKAQFILITLETKGQQYQTIGQSRTVDSQGLSSLLFHIYGCLQKGDELPFRNIIFITIYNANFFLSPQCSLSNDICDNHLYLKTPKVYGPVVGYFIIQLRGVFMCVQRTSHLSMLFQHPVYSCLVQILITSIILLYSKF